MTIDKEQLISLLIDKTGLERDQVEDQLQELINRIQQAAEEGKSFEVEGFGTFSMQEGELHFEPTDTLETEINNKYAGMKPIELIGAFKEPDGEEIPDMEEQQRDDEDKVWAFDEDAVEQDQAVEEPVAEAPEDEDQSDEAEQEVAEEARRDEDLEEVFEIDDDADKPDEDPDEPQDTTSEPKDKEPEKVAASSEDDPIGRFLVAAIVVIAIGLGGWLIYESGLMGGGTQSSSSQNKISQRTTDVPAQTTGDRQEEPTKEQAPNEDKQTDNTDSEPDQQKEVTKQGGPTAQQPVYGLRGTLNAKGNDGYTIVVHSLRVKVKAEKRKQGLQEDGFRAMVNQATVNGTTYYRVGVGQFETVEAAQQAVSRIPEEFRDNNFIKRIK